MFAWLDNIFKKKPSESTVSLQVVQAMCDIQRPMLRREDLERIDKTHLELQEDINSTRDQAKQIVSRMSSELERAKMRVSLISDSLMDPLISIDANGFIVSTNQTAERILGFTSTDLIGKSVNFLISNSTQDYAVLFKEEALRYIAYVDSMRPTTMVEYRDLYRDYVTGNSTEFLNKKKSVSCVTRSGNILPAEMFANILNVDSETPDNIIFLVIFRDTSEQVAAISEVESLTQFQLSLLAALPNPVFYKDSSFKIIGSNQAFDAFINKKPSDFIGKTNADLFPKDLESTINSIEDDLKDQDAPDIQIHKLDFRTLDNTEVREVMMYCTALRSKSQEFKGVLATFVDLTDLLSMKRFKETLLSSIPAPVYYLDRDLKYAGCNDKYCNLIGIPIDEVVGRTREQILTYDLQNAGILTEFYRQKDFEMLTSGQTAQSYESQVYNRVTKSILDVVVYRSVLRSVDGKFDGIVAVVTNISDIRAVQRFHQHIFDSSPLPVFYKDKDLKYITCNDLYARWYGLSKSDFVGRTRADLVAYVRKQAIGNPSKQSILESIEERTLKAFQVQKDNDIEISCSLESTISVIEQQVWNFELNEMRDVIFYKHALVGDEGFEGLICSMIDVSDLRRFGQAAQHP
jgi:PAS domain-containing protein